MPSKKHLSQTGRANFRGSIMIVDCHSLCHAAKAVGSDWALSGHKTGVVYIFMRKLLSIAKLVRPSKIVFAWDSSTSLRKGLSAEYKANRHEVDKTPQQEMVNLISYPQFDSLRDDVLPRIGFNNVFIQDGYEADDIIASVAIGADVDGQDVVIVSTDQDLLQMLSDRVSILNHISRKVTTREDFVAEWRIEPYLWASVKAIAGCAGDNVIGLRGVGEKTAVKFLRGDIGPNSKVWRRIVDNYDQIAKNLHLVLLPFEGTREFRLREDRINKNELLAVFNEYNMPSFLGSIGEWDDIIQR